LDHPIFHRYVEAKEKGLDVYAYSVTYHSEEKNKILKHWIEHVEQQPDEFIEWVYSQPGWNVSNVIMKNVGLYIYNFEITPFSDSDNAILLRFAKVFEQTYTRFLDLQKAETQAREAQIQLALERVRARTMAMQKSDELSETASILYQQLYQLGDIPEQINIGIVNEKENIIEWWITEQGGQQIDNKFTTPTHGAMVLNQLYDCWKEQKKSFVINTTGEELKEWIAYLREVVGWKNIDEGLLFPMEL
jgi:hypothetical protein